MSVFALDTDTATLLRHRHPVVEANVLAHAGHTVAITVITVEEMLSGWYAVLRQAKQPARLAHAYDELAKSTRFLGGLEILAFPLGAIVRYQKLVALRLRIGTSDLRIAAIALENNATLVTRNRRDFQRVPGLVIEDWSV
jgi:tRNA(fMet)-specific endonuclease VapC